MQVGLKVLENQDVTLSWSRDSMYGFDSPSSKISDSIIYGILS